MVSLPPAAARPHSERRQAREDTREQLLRAGLAAVLEGGWAASGVEKVLAAVGVPKGSFYHYFPSKDAFGQALIDAYQAFFLKRLQQCFGPEPARSLREQMAEFLAVSTAGMQRHGWRRGCLVGALGQELGGLHEDFRQRLCAAMAEWDAVLAVALKQAQARGELSAQADAERLARSFWAAWEGAVLRARLARHAEPLQLVIDDFLARLALR